VSANDELVSLYRDWQAALRRWGGDSYIAEDIFLRMIKRIEPDPCLDNAQFEAALEQLHLDAYPDAKGRPARLTTGEVADPRE
jgi:hypothetical protein